MRQTARPALALILALGGVLSPAFAQEAAPPRLPNILWITCEDTGPQLGCYGDKYAETPHLDRLAARGLRYRNAWSTAPVCAPARTTIITGVYPTSTGAEHMRSLVRMPGFMRMYPQLLRQRGYYCVNNSKEDYNLEKPGRVWDDSSAKAHYQNRRPGQPFFAVFNITVSHESQIRVRPHTLKHDPNLVRLPAYHPDTPEVRHDWAQYYDKVTEMDAQVGRRLRELAEAGLAEETIVFFYGDHGSGMPRSKRWPYNSGLQAPLIVYVPELFKHLAPKEYSPGGETDRLVSFADLAPTLFSLTGIKPPGWIQGRAFMGPHAEPAPPYLHGFRGRMDERYDFVRSARDQRYVYVRNYLPHLIYGQHLEYMFQTPTTQVWKRLYDEGKLHPPQTFFWERKSPEELYDLQHDPDEVKNLANSPAHREALLRLRQAQQEQARRTRDVGFLTEAEMAQRAAGTTIYELGHDPQRYPLDKIMPLAELASLLEADALPQLARAVSDQDSAARYWGVMGILMRGRPAVATARETLRQALSDSSPSVRIAAASALGQYGGNAELELALRALKELAPPDKNGVLVSMLALNALNGLGDKAASVFPFLEGMPQKDPQAHARYTDYVPRLVKSTLQGNR
jgi:uncharacterized sulfatase